MADKLASKGVRAMRDPLCEGPITGPPADAGEQLAEQLRQWMFNNDMLKDNDEKHHPSTERMT